MTNDVIGRNERGEAKEGRNKDRKENPQKLDRL
jgi:hypothetical protein